MSGYCSLQASARPSRPSALCTWPSEAAAAASRSKDLNFFSQSGPSSAAMRRRTNSQPIAGALDWSCESSAVYSAGSMSGTVDMICATFISGPLSPPSAARRSLGVALAVGGAAEIAARPPAAPRCRRRRCRPGHSDRCGRSGGRRPRRGAAREGCRSATRRDLPARRSAPRSRRARATRRRDRTRRARTAPAAPCGAACRRRAACRDISARTPRARRHRGRRASSPGSRRTHRHRRRTASG